jgi:hypothetical protein
MLQAIRRYRTHCCKRCCKLSAAVAPAAASCPHLLPVAADAAASCSDSAASPPPPLPAALQTAAVDAATSRRQICYKLSAAVARYFKPLSMLLQPFARGHCCYKPPLSPSPRSLLQAVAAVSVLKESQVAGKGNYSRMMIGWFLLIRF